MAKLLKNLYGHAESGKRWQRHLQKQLKEMGGIESSSSAYPSTWMFSAGEGDSRNIVLNIHVDDRPLSGLSECHAAFWHRLRQKVNLEEEVYVQEVRQAVGS